MSSLDDLTRALQQLVEDERRGLLPVELPKTIPASEFTFSKEVADFLRAREEYRAATRGVCVGQY